MRKFFRIKVMRTEKERKRDTISSLDVFVGRGDDQFLFSFFFLLLTYLTGECITRASASLC
jgi:hypothetical protein